MVKEVPVGASAMVLTVDPVGPIEAAGRIPLMDALNATQG
jgi:hypothetical protein